MSFKQIIKKLFDVKFVDNLIIHNSCWNNNIIYFYSTF